MVLKEIFISNIFKQIGIIFKVLRYYFDVFIFIIILYRTLAGSQFEKQSEQKRK